MGLLEQIFAAGIVGAGGAGFPTHKKLVKGAKLLLINAAECEPLLNSDRYVMRNFAPKIIEALLAIASELEIPRVVIGTKSHYIREIDALKKAIEEKKAQQIEIHGVDSFYPAGDEQVLIYEVTGETVPPGGIPLALGIVVINVTTALSVRDAIEGVPLTEKYVTVTGEVKNACVAKVPVGASVGSCIEAAGGANIDDYTIIMGGPMMGRQFEKEEKDRLFISKADNGIILLAKDHLLVTFFKKDIETVINRARSVCIQCSYCTEMCPRYLIGHQMRPHRVMRAAATGANDADLTDALLCCECGICELYACPMMLSPRQMNIHFKQILREKGNLATDKNIYEHYKLMRPYRNIAQGRFISRLQLQKYPLKVDKLKEQTVATVSIPLQHGVGKPSTAVVAVGNVVQKGQRIAGVSFEELGCEIHASISGVVTSLEGAITIESKGGQGA